MSKGKTMNVDTFIKAAKNGDLQEVKDYIDGGGDVNAQDKVRITLSSRFI